MEPLPFQQFQGKYTVLEELGRGASGICFHIKTKLECEHFVLKKISLYSMEHKKIDNEIKILSCLSHPNLIRLRQSYISKEYLYLLFDYSNQKDLQKIIKQRQGNEKYFPESLIWNYLHQMLSALQYLHQKGIIHRDIKPNNIFVNLQNDVLQIGDLGTAKICEAQNYSRIGTPLYLSPQIIKYQSYSQKVDIWSLGATVYHLTALRPPFQKSNFLKLAQAISYQQPQYPDHFSSRLTACIKQMLKKDPKLRPSCKQLLQIYFYSPELSGSTLVVSRQQVSCECSLKDNEQDDMNLELVSYQMTNFGNQQSQKQSQVTIVDKKVNESVKSQKTLRMCSIKSIIKKSYKDVQDAVVEHKPPKQLQVCEDDTIVLQVDLNDFTNFCGYYRQSRRPTKVNFDVPQHNSRNVLKLGRKSSLFKQFEAHQASNQSHFKAKNKENEISKQQIFHKRQESDICRKSKHGKLMSGLKPSKNEKYIQTDNLAATEIRKPEIVVIDRKPLLLPIYDM